MVAELRRIASERFFEGEKLQKVILPGAVDQEVKT